MTQAQIDAEVARWRDYLGSHAELRGPDLDELEDHLREQVSGLRAAGLHDDEAFLIAVKRIGSIDAVSREFGREHSERLWAQLILGADPEQPGPGWRPLAVVLSLAAGAALSLAVPNNLAGTGGWIARNAALLLAPWLVGYFAWRRSLPRPARSGLLVAWAGFALVANLYPFAEANSEPGATEILLILHLPIVAWFGVGVAHAAGRWRCEQERMDFVRFTGEWVIYYALFALGGGVLLGLGAAAFQMLGVDAAPVIGQWILPAGIGGATVVAAWLVTAKQGVVENMAPVLAAVFTPLMALLLLTLLVGILAQAAGGRGTQVLILADRNILILFDLILVLVLGLLLYALSARDPHGPPGLGDWLTLTLLVIALVVDVLMLAAMLTRISQYGASPNKVVALGLNLLLLVNLAWSARLQSLFVRSRRTLTPMISWQMAYLPVFAVWAGLVVLVVPPLFGFR